MALEIIPRAKALLLCGTLLYALFSLKEVGNFYQEGHAGFINAEVGLSALNTLENGFLKTKFGATNYKVIHNRAPEKEEYYVRYPYLQPLLLSLLWKVTGPSEVAARLVSILLVFLAFLVFYLIARELDFTELEAGFVYFSLCSFPVFYHYAGLFYSEITVLLPLALAYLFYLKHLKAPSWRYRLYFFLSLSAACQLFWYAYIAAFFFFLDSVAAYLFRKEKKSLGMALGLVLTVLINMAIFAVHTLWLVGSLQRIIQAFLWRTGIHVPRTQQYTWLDFIAKNIKRWWLFNPQTILLALTFLGSALFRGRLNVFASPRRRVYFLLLVTPLVFSLLLSHLVYYHDFLVVYFAFFLAPVSVDYFFRLHKMFASPEQKKAFLASFLVVLVLFAVFGLIEQPEEKMLDKEMDSYELYYVSKAVRAVTGPDDKIILSVEKVHEPQVRFYLRRDSFFLRNLDRAKFRIDSGEFSYYLTEDRPDFRPLVAYLLERYRAIKFGRYFLFDLEKPGKVLRVFKRQKRKPGLFFMYFVSPYHQPGRFVEITSSGLVKRVYADFEGEPQLKP